MVRVVTFVGLCAFTYVGVKALDNLVVWIAERREANVENFKLEREAAMLRQQLVKEIQEKHATTLDKGPEKHQMYPDKHFEFPFLRLKQQYDSKLQNRHQENKQVQLPDKLQEQQNNSKGVKGKQQYDSKLQNKHQENKQVQLPDKLQEQQDNPKGIKGKQQYDSKLQNRHQEDKQIQLPDKLQDQQDHPRGVKGKQEEKKQKLPDKPMKGQSDQKSAMREQENCPGEVHAECLECGETFDIVEPVPHIRKPDSPTSMI